VTPLRRLASMNRKDPAAYQKWISRAAAIDPSSYRDLAKFQAEGGRDDAAAKTFALWIEREPDEVAIANDAEWLIDYYERTGQTARSTALAERAAETYSSRGLVAKSRLLERRGDFPGAIDLLQKNRERYDDPGPLLGLLVRMQSSSADSRLSGLRDKLIKEYFPDGLKEFVGTTAPPQFGVRVHTENDAIRDAGLRRGDIVVAMRGYQLTNWRTYVLLRGLESEAPYVLTVWRNNQYFDLKPLPARLRFGVNLMDYRAP
jgi:hypothetical protein